MISRILHQRICDFITIYFIITVYNTVKCQLQPEEPLLLGISSVNLKVGMLFPENETNILSYKRNAAAATIALDRIYAERLLPPGSNISFVWKYERCIESMDAGLSYELINEDDVDFLILPACINGAIISGHIATYYNIPAGLWGIAFASQLASAEMYPTLLSVVPNYHDLAVATCELMTYLGWLEFSFIYQVEGNGGCDAFNRDFESVINARNDCILNYKNVVTGYNEEILNFTVEQIKSKSRIVVTCFDSEDRLRVFALRLVAAGMYTPDYVYLNVDGDFSKGVGLYERPYWIDTSPTPDGRDEDAYLIGKLSFQVTANVNGKVSDEFSNFSDEIVARMHDWPFYCNDCNGLKGSEYAQFLYDVIYLYGLAVGNAINETGSIDRRMLRNGSYLANQSKLDFEGMSGTVNIGDDGFRRSIYSLSRFNNEEIFEPLILIQVVDGNVNVSKLYSDAYIWDTRGGPKPLDKPICGYSGKECPISAFEEYKGYFIAGICIAVLFVTGVSFGFAYMINTRLKDIERQNKMWQVNYTNLIRYNPKKGMESMRSLQSGPSTTSTKFTFDSMKTSKNFNMYTYLQERVIGYKHDSRFQFTKEDTSEYRQMRAFDHDNINRFIGLSLDGPEILSIWRFCSRGSLRDVIQNNTLNMDSFFIFSLIRDIVEGLYFLHSSFLQCHGYLKSSHCLVDDRWQVKLSNFGLTTFRKNEIRKAKDQLWTAPELIRDNDHIGTKLGDIYSFAIVASEVINNAKAWEPSETKGNPEEIVYLVKKGGVRPLRPILQPAVSDLNPALLHLIRDCWSDNPSDRPKIETVRSLLKSMVTGRSTNLMDHVFNMLEQYAGSLEEEVEERTKELVEEKKKSDVLLYRMLPKQVADKLKLGQSVEPESFDSVTVFFSDVVSFTTLASKCTPLQVVNLLNDLYTLLDGIIGEYDVYKVETIGDGYLCVSGLPHRNGNEHARHIANMSLDFMKSLDKFFIPHLPGERISLRIGIHTGGCVAGVVGLAMPRYCLFGDTVNTASRMESNGKPNKIHLSNKANDFLMRVVGGFVTQTRGEVIIKGKGVMETFWLIGRENDCVQRNSNSNEIIQKSEVRQFDSEDDGISI